MKVWEKRFDLLPGKEIEEFTSSIKEDLFLYPYDIQASKIHSLMLEKCGFINPEEREKIWKGLERIKEEFDKGVFVFQGDEDIHMAVERRLKEMVGDIADKLHTARSRNDQVVVDEKLFLKDKIPQLQEEIRTLQKTILQKAEEKMGIIIPGFTHFRPAQPVLFSHWLLSYFWMLDRDRERLQDALKRVDIFPGGSLALAGTSLQIDREFVAKKLGFSQISPNSMDAVSDRDFILEFLHSILLLSLHLSRLAEELVIFSSPYFSWIKLPQEYMTGSSIMPHKMNPDTAELIRARTGRISGYLVSLSMVLKSLPLTYNRDLQEDKIPLYEGYRTALSTLKMMQGMVRGMEINPNKIEDSLKDEFLIATDIVEKMVEKGIPFREAYRKVGELVKVLEKEKRNFSSLKSEEWEKYLGLREEEGKTLLSCKNSVERKKSPGGTSPEEVRKQILKAKEVLGS